MTGLSSHRILFLAPLRYVASMPFAVETVGALARRGHFVDVIASAESDPPLDISDANVRIIPFYDSAAKSGSYILPFLKGAWRCGTANRYSVVIGLSQLGLIAASILHRRLGTPYVFFNDEIWFGDERGTFLGNTFGRVMKFLERRANRRALFTVTQDPERGRFLAQVNRIKPETLRYLPNSRAGEARISGSHYMHERFGLPPDDKIVLWAGGVGRGDGALELAREGTGWPAPFRMVFHFRTARITPYMQDVLNCHGKGRTFVSTTPVPYDNVADLMSSASIGTGIYRDNGINNRFMGASSGKINAFLQCGVPCIVNDYEGLRWVEEAGAGLCLKNTRGAFAAVQKIMGDYQRFQKNCIEVFESRLSFNKAFTPIAEELENRFARGNPPGRMEIG